MIKSFIIANMIGVVLVFSILVEAQQLPQDAKLKLGKVNFVGLQVQKPQEMIELGGLQVGQIIDAAAIRAALQKYTDSGLFKKITVRYQYDAETIELTFTAEEAAQQKIECVFDNFIWFTDQELSATVKQDLPNFDGTAASDDFTIGVIKKALTRLLQERKIAGGVTYERNEDTVSGKSNHVFSVKAPNLNVCSVLIVGLKANLKRELAEASQSHLNTAYSRMESNLYMHSALLPVYLDHGYLKAKFSPVQARPSNGSECKGAGVTVMLPVEEGLQYRWDGVDWSGNQAFTAKELDQDFKLKVGDIANADWIEDSFGIVQAVYGKRGYIAVRISPSPIFDDAKQRVRYQASVVEGRQYRAGHLLLTGVSENEAKKLQSRWKLKPGDIFNTLLVGEFAEPLRQDTSIKNVGCEVETKPIESYG